MLGAIASTAYIEISRQTIHLLLRTVNQEPDLLICGISLQVVCVDLADDLFRLTIY